MKRELQRKGKEGKEAPLCSIQSNPDNLILEWKLKKV